MSTCTLCMIAKNEGAYLREWLAYHRTLGFDEIVVYDNNSSDQSSVMLKAWAKKGLVDYRFWPLGATESPQITAYQDAIRRVKTEWILFLDCDEFLVLHSRGVQGLLRTADQSPRVAAIGINWRVFGSSGLTVEGPGLVIERFVKASSWDFAMNDHLKSFLKVDRIGDHIDMHLSDVDGDIIHPCGLPLQLKARGRSSIVDYSVAQVNHYYSKSEEEYRHKMSRGQAGTGEDSDQKYWYTMDSFVQHDRNDIVNISALKNIDNVIREMEVLESAEGRGGIFKGILKVMG